MGYNNIGQCLDCGKVYEPAGDHTPLPEKRQPPWVETPEDDRPRTSYAGTRKHVDVWEGRGVSHGYCRDCTKRDAPYLQGPGPEKGARMLGKSQDEAARHWWWGRVDIPHRPRKGK